MPHLYPQREAKRYVRKRYERELPEIRGQLRNMERAARPISDLEEPIAEGALTYAEWYRRLKAKLDVTTNRNYEKAYLDWVTRGK